MPRQVHLFDRPTRFVAGTVGQPGDRTFYLQATDAAGRTVSVALEKSQVQVLADRMNELLDEIASRANTVIPPDADVDDLEPLTPPVDEDAILSDSEDGPDALRVTITPGAARAFVARARRVVAAGRPPCPLCSLPLDPTGHVCPRQNGYRR